MLIPEAIGCLIKMPKPDLYTYLQEVDETHIKDPQNSEDDVHYSWLL